MTTIPGFDTPCREEPLYCDICDRVGAVPDPLADEILCEECEAESIRERILTSRPIGPLEAPQPRRYDSGICCPECGRGLVTPRPGVLGDTIRRIMRELWPPGACQNCHGAGRIVDDEPCERCGGTGEEAP